MVVSDNGTELTSSAILKWQKDRKVDRHYIESGEPQQNAFIELFNVIMHDELLNEEILENMHHACQLIAAWRTDRNHHRPQKSGAGLTPAVYAGWSREDQKHEQS